ncbi:MAG TPA: MOSC domain-containing protein, partial [Gemmatimonadales bacterium]
LVHLPEQAKRLVDPVYAPPGATVSFADAFPFLVISKESLADLNGRLAQPLPMNRFRPNLVIAGAGYPYAEDRWKQMRIGEITFSLVKPCSRCVITTTDQSTAERGKEPLRTLSRYRKVDGKAMFGQNAVHDRPGQLRVGDPVVLAG